MNYVMTTKEIHNYASGKPYFFLGLSLLKKKN